jgi:excisionase family DNA binding protein
MADRPMTVMQVARWLGCSDPHVYKMIHEGQLPSFKIGAHMRVLKSEVEKFMRATPQPSQRSTRKGGSHAPRKPVQNRAA